MASYQRAEGVLSEVIDGRAVVVEPSGGEVLTLNPVGTLIWEALTDPADESALVEQLRARYPAAPAQQVASDVAGFLADLTQAGIVISAR